MMGIVACTRAPRAAMGIMACATPIVADGHRALHRLESGRWPSIIRSVTPSTSLRGDSQAQAERIVHVDFLSVLVGDELVRRQDRLLAKRLKRPPFATWRAPSTRSTTTSTRR
jgi:hypothetical protein